MAGKKAEKAKEELAWRGARGFARSLERWMGGGGGKPGAGAAGEAGCTKMLDAHERKWARASYKKAAKAEKTLFLKSVMRFAYELGGGEKACPPLAKILGKMRRGRARLGEFYEYVLQDSDSRMEGGGGMRLGRVAARMGEGGLESEYYKWFRKEFGVPPGGARRRRIPLCTKSPAELRKARKKVDRKAVAGKIYSSKGRMVGSSAMGRILRYLKTGRLTKITLENAGVAASVAAILYGAGLEDVSVSGRRVNLGLRETIYNAKKRIAREGALAGRKEILQGIEYLKRRGIGAGRVEEARKLLDSGRVRLALEEVCRIALKSCSEKYVLMGRVKGSFGERGEEMVRAFKSRVGGEGESSLMEIYGMMERGNYPTALGRLRRIMGAIEAIEGDYPQFF
jgi:hypothetical protein